MNLSLVTRPTLLMTNSSPWMIDFDKTFFKGSFIRSIKIKTKNFILREAFRDSHRHQSVSLSSSSQSEKIKIKGYLSDNLTK